MKSKSGGANWGPTIRYCCYSNCKSNGRKNPELKFINFPKPTKNFERCAYWAKLCGKDQFFVERITQSTFVCEKHFPPNEELDWRKNPTLEPYPYDSNQNGSDGANRGAF